jgi:hypothetical protein
VLLLVGSVAVHQLVYGLAGVAPDKHAHAYLAWLTPALFALLVLGVAELALRVGRAHRDAAAPPRGRALWPVVSALLLAIFVAQETAETFLAGEGHAHALHDLVVGHGLWTALPVSLVVGAVLALALRGAAAVSAWGLEIIPARRPAKAAPPARRPRVVVLRRAPRDVVGPLLSGRAPPAAV